MLLVSPLVFAAMLSAIQLLSATTLPLLPYLLRGAHAADEDTAASTQTSFTSRIAALRIPAATLSDTRQQVAEEFQLNDDQLSVLDRCIAWLRPPSASEPPTPPSPVVLVHGTFGGGKTTLLVALIVYLDRVLSSAGDKNTVRVLVACMTNVAVDGILSALLHRSQECFVRVGSSKRIAANVLRHTLHASRGKGVEQTHQQAMDELRRQITERRDRRRQQQQTADSRADCSVEGADDDSAELRDMEVALAEMKAERGAERKRRLLGKRVVAVTCAASAFEVLNGCDFPIVLLDECSQMIEPASLLPMQRFRCQRLVAVGDPKQLQPQLKDVEAAASEPAAARRGDKPATVASCLAKPLFERLHNAGLPTVLLRYQYRMHPTLARMPNQLFYDGQLRDGVDEEARPALLRRVDDLSKSLGPLTFVNVPRGQEVRATPYSYQQPGSGSGSSWRNDSEVRVVVLTITALLQRGIPPSSIGVITLYRPQWAKLRSEIGSLMTVREAQLNSRHSAVERQRAHPAVVDVVAAGDSSEAASELWSCGGGPARTDEVSSTARRKRVRAEGVQVSTVDSFQGGEKDIVILSTVRTSPSDFLDNPRRINVALTRARHHLIVVGHHSALLQSAVWKPVVTFVSARCPGCFFPTDGRLPPRAKRHAGRSARRHSEPKGGRRARCSRATRAVRRAGGEEERGEAASKGRRGALPRTRMAARRSSVRLARLRRLRVLS